MEGQLLIAQLAVLLEERAAQYRFGRQPLPSGGLDATSTQISHHQTKHVGMLIQRLRHRLQLMADLVRGEKIEYTGLGRYVLWHCRLGSRPLESVHETKVYLKPPGFARAKLQFTKQHQQLAVYGRKLV